MSEERREPVRYYVISEACERIGVDQEFVVRCIRAQWVHPAAPEQPALDDEDLARVALIHELMENFGANAEAIPVILHLVDQLHYIERRARAI